MRRNNDELLATWGNLVNRTLTNAYRNFGVVPTPGELTPADTALLESVARQASTRSGRNIEQGRFRAALAEAMRLASQVNQYVSDQAPWALVKPDKARAGTILFVALRAVDSLKTMFTPFLPHTSQLVHELLGNDGSIAGELVFRTVTEEGGRTHEVLTGDYSAWVGRWEPSSLEPGQKLQEPRPLFRKLDEAVASEELQQDGRRRRVIDTHAHLGEDAAEVLARAQAAGVERVVAVATTLAGAREALALAERHEAVYACLGIHPHEAGGVEPSDVDGLRQLLEHPRAVAVGETGLDYYRDYAPRDAQRALFERAARAGPRRRQAGRHPHARGRRRHPRAAPPTRRPGRPALLLVACAPRAGPLPRLVRLVRRQRDLQERVRAAGRRAGGTGRPAPRRDRQPVSRAAAGAGPSQRARLRRAHVPGARRGAGRRAVGSGRADRCERRGGVRAVSVRPRKALGQHFLVDDNILRVIERLASLSAGDVVLEVGPGLGVLTRFLAARVALVHAVEIDRRLEPELAGIERTELHWGDVLGLDLASLEPPPRKLVANLPYNVATPVVAESLRLESLAGWCVMVQREVADRFFARPSTKAYGAVSVLVQLAAERTGLPPGLARGVPSASERRLGARRVPACRAGCAERGEAPRRRGVLAPPQDARESLSLCSGLASRERGGRGPRDDRPGRGRPCGGARASRVRPRSPRPCGDRATRPRRSTSGSWSARGGPTASTSS